MRQATRVMLGFVMISPSISMYPMQLLRWIRKQCAKIQLVCRGMIFLAK